MQKIHLSTLLNHYKRRDIQEEIVAAAVDKEVAVSFGGVGYGKRPDVLNHPRDVIEFVKKGVTSFHCSEELWHNPLQIETGMKKADLEDLRKGWDLVLDIDCPWLEYSQISADLIVQALKYHGIENIGLKFSGNHGFHIAVPFTSLPERVHGEDSKKLFPEGPRKIAVYLQEMIRNHLSKRILEGESISKILEKTKIPRDKLMKKGELDPFEILKIDTVLISSRHLYRMPYSFNEKSGLVSIPVAQNKIIDFEKSMAAPEHVSVDMDFMPKKVNPGEASKLLVQAFDFHPPASMQEEKTKSLKQKEDFAIPLAAVPQQYFPPCIQNITKGMQDGKKRALFVLVNFLSSLGWNSDQIETYLQEWNKRNPEPLREQMLVGHLRYHTQNKKKVLPPNCANAGYMVGMGVCKPDQFCGANTVPGAQDFAPRIKNPVSYALKRQRIASQNKENKDNSTSNVKQVNTKHPRKETPKTPPDVK